MLNSRDINLLREDVAENCRTLICICKEQGLPVLVTGTVRDEEYQLECVKNGTAPKSATKPTFHSVKAGLAFDVCKNVKGQEYSDTAFFAAVGAVGRQIGFTWGGDWKSFKDKPHFQWDNHGEWTNSMILSEKYPPTMPKYKEEKNLKNMDNTPGNYAKEAVEWAQKEGVLKGDTSGNLKLHEQVTREELMVFLHRFENR